MHFKYKRSLLFFGVLQVWTKISAWQIDHLPRSMTRSQTRREVVKIPGGTSSLAKAFFLIRCVPPVFHFKIQRFFTVCSSGLNDDLQLRFWTTWTIPSYQNAVTQKCKCEHVSKLQTLAEMIPYCSYQKQTFQCDLGGPSFWDTPI